MTLPALVDSNILVLQSAANILDRVSPHQFNQVIEPYISASMGKHFRHILDHYNCFLAGYEQGLIDYDDRPRNKRAEIDPGFASDTAKKVIKALEGLKYKLLDADSDRSLEVTLSTSVDEPAQSRADSSISRELIFLHGHTTHHFALIAILLKLLDLETEQGFGFSPSTLAYNDSLRCAQ